MWRASLSLPSACKADVILTTPHTHIEKIYYKFNYILY